MIAKAERSPVDAEISRAYTFTDMLHQELSELEMRLACASTPREPHEPGDAQPIQPERCSALTQALFELNRKIDAAITRIRTARASLEL